MMRPTFLPILLVAPLALLGCSSDLPGGSATFPEAPLVTMASESGALSVEVRTAPTQPPSRGEISVEYRITQKDGTPAEGLVLTPEPWMPVMQHGASVAPTVSDEGAGHYVISRVELFMPGTWELRTTIAGSVQDRATPTFEIP